MKPFWILGGLIAAILLFARRAPAASAPPPGKIPLPGVPLPPGKIPLPGVPLPPGTLSQAETDLIISGTTDALYAAAMQSQHRLFVASAAAKLEFSGDSRAAALAKRAQSLPAEQSGGASGTW